MKIEKIHLEYVFEKASKNTLWNYLTSSSGLSGWFADDVEVKENIYTFVWNKIPEEAELLNIIPNNKVRFRWIEDENPESYFEFKLHTDEITGAIVLEVTDFSEPDEKEHAISLWDSHIKLLKRTLGI
ncbi:MAG: hypothetical protein LBI82_05115 [Dysgonamonadaceae bacterium]|jgi:uncharacterized protein YndB with AHSA1/START domain|nr:hypothetical protein [Dysgonamonadaceae bacterium]